MRVIEPQKKQSSSDTKKIRSRSLRKSTILASALVVSLLVVAFFYMQRDATDTEIPVSPADTATIDTPVEVAVQSGPIQFSGNEFRLLYENTLLPNTEPIELPPPITGNDIADARIRKIAESRGYRLRRNPSTVLKSYDGYPLQELMNLPWQNLKKEASAAGHNMSIVSGFRNVADQRELFLSRLSVEGISISEVEAGTADEEINTVLITTSIPGYSKHHSGYVLDLLCEGWVFEDFKNSACHDWLEANNYEKAKKHGFIPSYPDDADLQGPDPEAWEYAYVGAELLNY